MMQFCQSDDHLTNVSDKHKVVWPIAQYDAQQRWWTTGMHWYPWTSLEIQEYACSSINTAGHSTTTAGSSTNTAGSSTSTAGSSTSTGSSTNSAGSNTNTAVSWGADPAPKLASARLDVLGCLLPAQPPRKVGGILWALQDSVMYRIWLVYVSSCW